MIEKEIADLQTKVNKPQKTYAPLKGKITFDDVAKLDLRIGTVLEAKKVPKSKKLLELQIDLGFEKRTVVSGIAKDYPEPSVLVGKKIILVANLEAAELMGVTSQGMIFAADNFGSLVLPEVPAEPGSVVS